MAELGRSVVIAANNGEIGGGEVMLLAIAEGLRDLGVEPRVLGPADPDGLVRAAHEKGFQAQALDGTNRLDYAKSLRRWRRENPRPLLWCNGLLPAVATTGMSHRVVHLHQLPGRAQWPMAALARLGARATLVPSEFMASRISGAKVLPNWSPALERVLVPRGAGPIRCGFLGRPSEAKGIPVLVEALSRLSRIGPKRFTLRIAGEPRFVDARERAVIEARLRRLGGSVQRLGWMPPDEFFGTIDLLVVPSVWDEPFGLVVTEAMSARVPVVVSDAGALPDLVGPDHPWIAKAGDAGSLAEAIAAAAAALPAEDVVAKAHRRWSEEFSPEAGRAGLRGVLASLDLRLDEGAAP